MAAPAANASAFTTLPSSSSPSSTNQKQLFKSTLPFPSYPNNPSNSQRRSLRITASLTNSTQNITPTSSTEHFTSRFPLDQPRKGADILVEALERQGVTDVFAYPGGASMEIHQALTRSTTIRNVLPRHEQGGIFAAEGYARSSGRPGICIATSGPGATNFVSGLVDAMLDSVPLIAITGHVPRRMIGTDAFQETPIVEVAASSRFTSASPRFTSASPRFTSELGDRSPSQHREVLFIFEFHSEHWRPQ